MCAHLVDEDSEAQLMSDLPPGTRGRPRAWEESGSTAGKPASGMGVPVLPCESALDREPA